MTKTWCVGVRRYSESKNQIVYKNVNPETQKFVTVIRESCKICGRNKSQIFTKKMTWGKDFQKRGNCENKHCSDLSNQACSDLNSKSDILKLNKKCPNKTCKCQKHFTFNLKQFQLGGAGFKNTIKSYSKEVKSMRCIS